MTLPGTCEGCGGRAAIKRGGIIRCATCDSEATATVGTIGVLCGVKTLERVVRKTPAGPLHLATCNRWHGHSGQHREVRGRDFRVLYEWGNNECRAPDWKEAKRKEVALAKAAQP